MDTSKKTNEPKSSQSTSSTRPTPNLDNVCAVCHETLAQQNSDPLVKLTPCNHKLHRNCIVPWFTGHDTCPICRVVVATYVELDAGGSETNVVTNVVRRIHNYPSTNSFVFLAINNEVSISYIFLADAFILRTGSVPVEFIRMDRIPARVQFTVAANSMVPIYHLLIMQAKYYVLGISNQYYSLEALLTSIARRMSLRRAAIVETNVTGPEGNANNTTESVTDDSLAQTVQGLAAGFVLRSPITSMSSETSSSASESSNGNQNQNGPSNQRNPTYDSTEDLSEMDF